MDEGDLRGALRTELCEGVSVTVVDTSPLGVLDFLRDCLWTGARLAVSFGGSTAVFDRILEKDIGSARIGLISSIGLGGRKTGV